LFQRGFSDTDVSRKLKVARNTAKAYRTIYERKITEEARANPRLLQDVLGNTIRMLGEYEHIRKAAWKEYAKADRKVEMECPHCEEVVQIIYPDPELRNKLLNTAMKAQSERAKLYGTMGVKADALAAIAAVKHVQDALIKFMTEMLCDADRAKLITYLTSPEMAPYMGAAGTIDVESWEDTDEPAQLAAG
jgi:tRNA G26 N,N-dimethylase Trm1